MDEFVYLDDDYGDYVKINGLCYQKISASAVPPDFVGPPDDQGFKSCIDCADGLTKSSSSSSSSSTDVLDLSSSLSSSSLSSSSLSSSSSSSSSSIP